MTALAAILACLMIPASSQYQLESAIHEAIPCGDEATERKLREILQEALDNALREHIERTFDVLMRNYASGTDSDEARARENAARGVRGGVNAYIQSQKSLARWRLLRC